MHRQLVTALFVTVMAWLGAAEQQDLKPGPFRPIPGAQLGQPVDFENEIDTTKCYPLMISGQVVSWLAGAYAFDKELLVQRCVEYDPTIEQTRGNRHGAGNQWWEEARLSPKRDTLLVSRLQFPGWSLFSNPAFCRSSIAYWGIRQKELVPTIFDLRARAALASRSMGVVSLETDNSGFLPTPSWNATCSEATFDGSPARRPVVKLSAQH